MTLSSHADSGVTHALLELLRSHRTCVLTGAGCSTESGIPDYRGPGTRARAKNPMQHREFMSSEEARKRYWARSAIGWPRISKAKPNAAHRALAEMQSRGHVTTIVTQNVDRLHQAAGSRDVIELHGALADVVCLSCGARVSRHDVQARILDLNPRFTDLQAEMSPDGDAELASDLVAQFVSPTCLSCGGALKPDVVFFGDSVSKDKVDRAYACVDDAEALLVVGSSLAVFSGYRFVLRARARSIPIAIVNLGETRGDPHATLRVDARAGEVLPTVASALIY